MSDAAKTMKKITFRTVAEAWGITQDSLEALQDVMKKTGRGYCDVVYDTTKPNPGMGETSFWTGCSLAEQEDIYVDGRYTGLFLNGTGGGGALIDTDRELSLGEFARVVAENINDCVKAEYGQDFKGIKLRIWADAAPEIETLAPARKIEMPLQTRTPDALKHWLVREVEKLTEEYHRRVEIVAQGFVDGIAADYPGSAPEAGSINGGLYVSLLDGDGERRKTTHMRSEAIDEIWPGLAEQIEAFEDFQASIDYRIADAPFSLLQGQDPCDLAPIDPDDDLPSAPYV